MSTDTTNAASQAKVAQFLQLLPLTLEIAGLQHMEHGKYFNDDQMEVRARNLKAAYKQARRLIKEIAAE